MIKRGDTAIWEEDIGIVIFTSEFNHDRGEEWKGCVATVFWQKSQEKTIHIFFEDGRQAFGFPLTFPERSEEW